MWVLWFAVSWRRAAMSRRVSCLRHKSARAADRALLSSRMSWRGRCLDGRHAPSDFWGLRLRSFARPQMNANSHKYGLRGGREAMAFESRRPGRGPRTGLLSSSGMPWFGRCLRACCRFMRAPRWRPQIVSCKARVAASWRATIKTRNAAGRDLRPNPLGQALFCGNTAF